MLKGKYETNEIDDSGIYLEKSAILQFLELMIGTIAISRRNESTFLHAPSFLQYRRTSVHRLFHFISG